MMYIKQTLTTMFNVCSSCSYKVYKVDMSLVLNSDPYKSAYILAVSPLLFALLMIPQMAPAHESYINTRQVSK